MHLFELTRRLVDIESITPNEREVGHFLLGYLEEFARQTGGSVERMDVSADPERFNIFVTWGEPIVTLSTHLDTVPPFIPSSEDDQYIYGRGACDVKGLIAAMCSAAGLLLKENVRNFALLFVVGEERNSAGALHAAKNPRGSRFLINGEPTENKLALGSKGAYRFVLRAKGRMAHSAYPEYGESAILKLLNALQRLRGMEYPTDPILGSSTTNIGVIRGGRAPNVIPDEAEAEVFVRLVDDGTATRRAIQEAMRFQVEVEEVLCIPAVHLEKLPGFKTTVVSYTTDIPAFEGAWGKPYLIGPGSILVAHTKDERIPKKELLEAPEIYAKMVRQLLTSGETGA
ncbi:MAG: M20/M25/M40 family metallo-hydrolase [Bryobacterales bacterium]|nr:M20/M25/M40 family metallo-hydrolase [Bryobacterales bacterium]